MEMILSGNMFGFFDQINDTGIPRFIENPEWKKSYTKKRIEEKKNLIEMYSGLIANLTEEIKKLEKDLDGKE